MTRSLAQEPNNLVLKPNTMGDSTPREELRALFQEAHATSEARVVAVESQMEARVAQTKSKLEAQLQQLSR